MRDLAGVRDGGFSWLRKTFATYASEAADQVAVDFIMGHVDSNISGVYRQLVRSKRLQKPVEAVRTWLFPEQHFVQYGAQVNIMNQFQVLTD